MKIENPSNRLLGILVQTGSSFAGQNVPRRSNIEKHVIFEAMEDRFLKRGSFNNEVVGLAVPVPTNWQNKAKWLAFFYF